MIATPTALLICGTFVMCFEPRMPGFVRPADLYIIPAPGVSLLVSEGVSSSPKGGLRSRKRDDIVAPKATNPRTITIPAFIPPLPYPAYWERRR